MNTIKLELEKEHSIDCVLNKENKFELKINKEDENIILLELEKIDILNLINNILKVYSIALSNGEDIFIQDIVKGHISLEYNCTNNISTVRISSNMENKLDTYKLLYLKLSNKDLLSLSIMLSAILTN